MVLGKTKQVEIGKMKNVNRKGVAPRTAQSDPILSRDDCEWGFVHNSRKIPKFQVLFLHVPPILNLLNGEMQAAHYGYCT